MKKPATAIVVIAVVAGATMIGVTAARRATREAPCSEGFVRRGPRCLVAPGAPCPAPLALGKRGCEAPETSVADVPATRVTIGPSDWEAEGRVAPRVVEVGAFRIDRLEVSVGRACASAALTGAPFCADDPARAAYGVTLAQARAFCKERGGRLPTEDEWIAAAAGGAADRARRYPWGDTGAVCHRAAWGLRDGPCATGATGPDTVGAHPDGRTPLGIDDLAGNVAEWVETGGAPAVRGGSWETSLATELRTWVRRSVAAEAVDPTIGLRCAYDADAKGAMDASLP